MLSPQFVVAGWLAVASLTVLPSKFDARSRTAKNPRPAQQDVEQHAVAHDAGAHFALAHAELTDRRVVDRVDVGDDASEFAHGYAGDHAEQGTISGTPFRVTSGWLHYTLTTFDDTPVTVSLSFVATDSSERDYELVVEDRVIATRMWSHRQSPVVEIDVPFAITKGKAHIALYLRATTGQTPALREIRTIQDHHEQDHHHVFAPQHLLGVSR